MDGSVKLWMAGIAIAIGGFVISMVLLFAFAATGGGGPEALFAIALGFALAVVGCVVALVGFVKWLSERARTGHAGDIFNLEPKPRGGDHGHPPRR